MQFVVDGVKSNNINVNHSSKRGSIFKRNLTKSKAELSIVYFFLFLFFWLSFLYLYIYIYEGYFSIILN